MMSGWTSPCKTLHQGQHPPTKCYVRVNVPLQNTTSGSASTNKTLCQGQHPPAKRYIRVSVRQQRHYVRVNIHQQNIMSGSTSTCKTCQGQCPLATHYVKVSNHLQNITSRSSSTYKMSSFYGERAKKKWSSSQDYGTWEVIKTPTEMPTRQKGGQQPKNNPTSSSCMISSMISVGLLLYFVAALMASRNNWNRKRYNIYNIFQFHTWLRFCSSSKAESVMMLHCRNTALIYFSDDQKSLMNSETSSRQKAKLWLAGRASFSVFTGLEALLPVLGIQASALLQLF